jgi:hypothetical protein
VPDEASQAAPPPSLHPWRRYFARMFDIYVFSFGAAVVVGILFPNLFSSKSDAGNDQITGLLFLAAYIPVEAFCLYAFSTSLGKALYGIRIASGSQLAFPPIAFSQALRRSMLVWFRGLGMGIGIVTLFTLVTAFNNLKKNRTTTWDADMGWTVTHSEYGALRWIGILTCWAGLTFVIIVLIEIGSGTRK